MVLSHVTSCVTRVELEERGGVFKKLFFFLHSTSAYLGHMELVNVQLGTGRAQYNKSCKTAQFKTDNIIWTNLRGWKLRSAS